MRLFVVALVVLGAGIVVSSAAALRFESGDCREPSAGTIWTCPTGTAGTAYAAQLRGAGSCGPALPYQYRVLNGTLPPGITLSTSGLIGGTPTTTGTYEFWVELSDQDPPSQSWCTPAKSEREFRIDVNPGLPPLVIDTASVPIATMGASYAATLSATPAGAQTWAVTGGALPLGLQLDAATGVIAGTPATSGSSTFTVTVSDAEKRSARHEYRLDVRAPLIVTALAPQGEPGGLPLSEVGIPLSSSLIATGGSETFSWSLAAGTPPSGVSLAADGTLAGTPRQAGRFPFTAQVSDTEGRIATVDVALTVAARLSIKTGHLRRTRAGRLYRAKLATRGGVGPVRWRLLRGKLPMGVRFAKKVGLLIGKPRLAAAPKSKHRASYRFTVQAEDALGMTSKRTLVLVVAAKPKPRP